MKIAITGGGGFIGGATVKAAEQAGHEAWLFDRSDGNDIMGDLGGLNGAEAVIHLAGLLGTHELFDQVEEAVNINVVGSLRIMQWCLDRDARYIGILMPDVFPSIYTATKVASARLADALHMNRDLRVAHVRAFNVFGPGQKWGPGHPQKIVPTFAIQAWRRQPIPIWGDGLQTVDLVHVDDCARMLVTAVQHAQYPLARSLPTNPVFDAGTGIAMTVGQVAKTIARMTGWMSPELDYRPMRLGERPTEIVATGEGWGQLDWRPRWDLRLLEETVRWYKTIAQEH
jgi:UDP-glucose 4-epimerase